MTPAAGGAATASRVAAVFFDLYGTLVDLAGLDDACESIAPGQGRDLAARWRARQMEATWLRTCMDAWAPFDVVTRDSLVLAAREIGAPVTADGYAVEAFTSLPARAGIGAAIRRLTDAGLVVGVLSNGTGAMIEETLDRSGLASVIGLRLSVDPRRAYKPAPRVYGLAGEATGLPPSRIGFVTANGWDAAGAGAFGFRVAWLQPARGQLPAVGPLTREPSPVDVDGIAPHFGA